MRGGSVEKADGSLLVKLIASAAVFKKLGKNFPNIKTFIETILLVEFI